MSEIILKTNNLKKLYGNKEIIKDISLNVKSGEILGIVGQNGAGKTTLLRLICGLINATSGSIEIFSQSTPSGLNKSRSRIGAMIETPSFYPYLSAKKNLEYYRIQRGIPEKNVVDDALKTVGLDNVGNKNFKNFSLGMKQRLGLALAIMCSPDLLILDEPVNGLDPMGIVQFREILKKLNKEKNITIIISSHILSELSQMATSYCFINKGQLIQQVSEAELEDKCKKYISIKVDNVEKASTVLENSLDCHDYEVLNGNIIEIYSMIETPEKINETFVENGIKVSSLINNSLTLEDYFLSLIKED